MTKKEEAQQQREDAIAKLREWVKPGDTVYTVLRHRAASGMSRSISLQIIRDGKPEQLDFWVARALDEKIDQKNGGIKMGGAGMDMGFALVYNLSYCLFPKGFGCIGKGEDRGSRCPSNDHSNGDRDYTSNNVKQIGWATCDACCDLPEEQCAINKGCDQHAHWHNDGGYALRQEWL